MKTLYIERSTGECRSGGWVEDLDLQERPDRIIVGQGPGSFAGVRSALAFAQGYALGSGCEVFGLPSPCALADGTKLAVVGDARRGLYWVALFDGFSLVRDIFQSEESGLEQSVPSDYAVVTPDAERVDALLSRVFAGRYRGGAKPAADGLRRFVDANPSVLVREPLPIYLNPAVRPSENAVDLKRV